MIPSVPLVGVEGRGRRGDRSLVSSKHLKPHQVWKNVLRIKREALTSSKSNFTLLVSSPA